MLVAWDLLVRHNGFLEAGDEGDYAVLLDALDSHPNLVADLVSGLIHAINHDSADGGSMLVKGAIKGASRLAEDVEHSTTYWSVLLPALGGAARGMRTV